MLSKWTVLSQTKEVPIDVLWKYFANVDIAWRSMIDLNKNLSYYEIFLGVIDSLVRVIAMAYVGLIT